MRSNPASLARSSRSALRTHEMNGNHGICRSTCGLILGILCVANHRAGYSTKESSGWASQDGPSRGSSGGTGNGVLRTAFVRHCGLDSEIYLLKLPGSEVKVIELLSFKSRRNSIIFTQLKTDPVEIFRYLLWGEEQQLRPKRFIEEALLMPHPFQGIF